MQKNLLGLVIIAAALIFTACGDDSGTSSGGSGYNASKNTLTDSRDGQTYKTVVIGNQIWMAENLNYNAEGSLCYDDDKSNCKKYGRLYPWLAAIDTTKAEIVSTLDGPDFVVKNPHQGVCPKGWHIPSVGEFKTLINYVGNNTDVLRSVSGWTKKGSDEEWPGTDEYGFNLLPVGEHRNCDGNVGFGGLGYNTSMWDDQTDMTGNENNLYVDSKEGFSLEKVGECETSALSIRCLKDDVDDDVFNSDSVEINESSSTSNSGICLDSCGDSSTSDEAAVVITSPCAGLILITAAYIVDVSGTKLVVYPVNPDGSKGKVTLTDGSVFGSFDGSAIYDATGVLYMAVTQEMLSTVCEANVTFEPATTYEIVLNSSSSAEIEISANSSADAPISSAAINPTSSSVPVDPTSSVSADPTSSTVAESSNSVSIPPATGGFKDISEYPVAAYKDISGNGTYGWNSRYWDACKPHCSWISDGQEGRTDTTTQESYEAGMTTARNCNIHDVEVPTFTLGHAVRQYWMGYEGTTSACESSAGAKGVFTCTDMAPVAVNDTLSYAYVAGPGSSTICGKCFHLQYDGSFHDASSSNAPKETHKALKGKHIVVMTSNIGQDVADGQFDLMVPGGGPGIFNALNIQVNGNGIEWGAQYGGFLTYCQGKLGYDKGLSDYQSCVLEMCDAAFGNAGLPNLLRGCQWFANWYMAADNPTYQWEEVECPQYLLDHYLTTINTSKSNRFKWHDDWSSYQAGDPLDTLECLTANYPNGCAL